MVAATTGSSGSGVCSVPATIRTPVAPAPAHFDSASPGSLLGSVRSTYATAVKRPGSALALSTQYRLSSVYALMAWTSTACSTELAAIRPVNSSAGQACSVNHVRLGSSGRSGYAARSRDTTWTCVSTSMCAADSVVQRSEVSPHAGDYFGSPDESRVRGSF